jgi:hypothetical protein
MGLNCTHGAFDGAYSAFNRFRQYVAEAIGGSFPPHKDKSLDSNFFYFDDEVYEVSEDSGLFEFFNHSDCDGFIENERCLIIADELEKILPLIKDKFNDEMGSGHILRNGGVIQVTMDFINGCRLAYESGEDLEFR